MCESVIILNLRLKSLSVFPIIFLLTVFNTAVAQAEVLNFESLRTAGTFVTFVGSPYAENGFTLTSDPTANAQTAFTAYRTGDLYFAGSTALVNNTVRTGLGSATTTLTKIGGGLFDLTSIELAKNQLNDPLVVTFVGVRVDGTTLTQVFTVTRDNTFFYTGNSGFETFTFTGFSNLLSVSWTNNERNPFLGDNVQFDNISVSDVTPAPIPEPVTLILFATGLLSAAGVRRLDRKE